MRLFFFASVLCLLPGTGLPAMSQQEKPDLLTVGSEAATVSKEENGPKAAEHPIGLEASSLMKNNPSTSGRTDSLF